MGNVQKMKCDLKGSVNMKLQDGNTVKLTKVRYVPQAMKKLLSLSGLISKGATMESTQEKMTIKKHGVSVILETKKVKKV